jgi:hypothetical protein
LFQGDPSRSAFFEAPIRLRSTQNSNLHKINQESAFAIRRIGNLRFTSSQSAVILRRELGDVYQKHETVSESLQVLPASDGRDAVCCGGTSVEYASGPFVAALSRFTGIWS